MGRARWGSEARRALAVLGLAGATLVARPAGGAGAELYGRPLRGLTRVPVSEVGAPKHAGKSVRIAGVVKSPPFAVAEGGAAVPLVSDGGFALPDAAPGTAIAAEGKAETRDGGLVFVATGLEIRR